MMTSMYNQLRAAVFQDEEAQKKTVGGIGLILDTRLKQAQSRAREAREALRSIEGAHPASSSQELLQLGGGAKSEYQTLKERVAVLGVEEEAAAEEDAIVIHKMHVEGPAYLSGAMRIGDVIVSVDGVPLLAELPLAGRLIRGEVGSEVRLRVRCLRGEGGSEEGGGEGVREGREEEVCLVRKLIPDHAALYEDDENSDPSHHQ